MSMTHNFNVKQSAEMRCIYSLFPLLLYINCNSTLPSLCEASHKDGWCEGFEQREIAVDDCELHVHFWNSDEWSIQTEQELFAPKLHEQNGMKMGGMTLG